MTIAKKKYYNTMFNVGKVKYLVNYHNGINKYSDGSAFYDVRSFKNKKEFNAFVKSLEQKGYIYK